MCRHAKGEMSGGMSRRRWLSTAGALTATAALIRESSSAEFEPVDPMAMEPHQHACVDHPYVPHDADIATRLDSPIEGVIATEEGRQTGLAAAAAPQSAAARFGPASAPAKAAYQNRWDRPDKKLRVAFVNGVKPLRDGVMDLAREWSKFANIEFDLAQPGERPQIRVRFNRGFGHWSHIGSDSTTEIARGPDVPSMNFAFLQGSTEDLDKAYSKFVVLHEFGHALGCIHEHQHPEAKTEFRKTAAVYDYFRKSLGTTRNEDVDFNIYRRWNLFNLIKFSKYDTKSIMHYAFPAWVFADGQERVQNYSLSLYDMAFAAIVYPGREGVSVEDLLDRAEKGLDPSTGTTTTATNVGEPKFVIINGEAVGGFLSPGGVAKYRFTVAADQASSRMNIASHGGTQVLLQLFETGDLTKEITPAGADTDGKPLHGTTDYTNDVIKATLPAGTYEVRVRHTSPRGGGGFGISVKTGGELYPRLATPNTIQK